MKILFLSLLIALICGALGYVSSGNLYVAISIFMTYFLYGFFHAKKKIVQSNLTYKCARECRQFLNNFLLSMSIRGSLAEAFENATMNADEQFKSELEYIEHLAIRERIDYLNKYFRFDIYYMFLNILTLYEDQGGDILTMSETLLQEVNRIEEAMIVARSLSTKRTMEFFILWSITIGIVIFMRFGLSSFYSRMLNGLIVIIMTALLFALLLVSIHLAINKFSHQLVQENNHHETI
ncbi:MAG: hypothetical protein PHV19_03825 [Bacilli bacterium]|nr:hypothetical protein [Bacilli bacterium]